MSVLDRGVPALAVVALLAAAGVAQRIHGSGAKESFSEWLKRLDGVFQARLMVSYNDVSDFNWRNLYDDGYSPEDAFDDWRADSDEGSMLGDDDDDDVW